MGPNSTVSKRVSILHFWFVKKLTCFTAITQESGPESYFIFNHAIIFLLGKM